MNAHTFTRLMVVFPVEHDDGWA